MAYLRSFRLSMCRRRFFRTVVGLHLKQLKASGAVSTAGSVQVWSLRVYGTGLGHRLAVASLNSPNGFHPGTGRKAPLERDVVPCCLAEFTCGPSEFVGG